MGLEPDDNPDVIGEALTELSIKGIDTATMQQMSLLNPYSQAFSAFSRTRNMGAVA